MPDIEALKIPLPPIPQQKEVLSQIDSRLAKLDALTTRLNGQLQLVAERRRALIITAVTGQIDVSRAA
jgi:type I restriction enzyme S subunit